MKTVSIISVLIGISSVVMAQQWVELGSHIDGEAAGDWSGVSVSLSSDGSRVAIGAQKNNGNGIDAGHVRIYEYVAGKWVQLGADIDGEAAGDSSGGSVRETVVEHSGRTFPTSESFAIMAGRMTA